MKMKNLLLLLISSILTLGLKAQQAYCDFEGIKVIHFGDVSGTLDSIFVTPKISENDSSHHCARYLRGNSLYDNIKIYTNSKMTDVEPFANNSASAPKITMKLYTTAPVGTPIQLQLGTSLNNFYPTGIHSEYIAVTTVENEWQNLTFSFLQSPTGGLTSSTNLDKVVVLFNPGSTDIHSYYFDDIVGPSLVPLSVQVLDGMPVFKLYQNSPNPAKEITHINLQLNSAGYVSLKLFDMIGNPIITLLDGNMKTGYYSIPVETESIPNGIYFYVLKKDGVSRSMKMIVSK
jgi:hypothetical protein